VYDDITVIDDSTDLSTKRDKLKGDQSWEWSSLSDIKNNSFTYSDFMCYINNMRFDNICTLIDLPDTNRVINMDVDQLFINSFDINDMFKQGDIVTFNEHDQLTSIDTSDIHAGVWIPEVWTGGDTYTTDYPLNDESIIGVVNSETTRDYFNQAKRMIHEDFLNWDADYNTINYLYNQFADRISFTSPELKYNDRWYYSPDSVIWNGAANNRDKCQRYIDKRRDILNEIS
tara:strand:- start:559 stop:1248 length:690 start_codon:yes stop_codon:yes gene_type:complete